MGSDPRPAASLCGATRQAALLAAPAGRSELVGVIHAGLVESVASAMPAKTAEPEPPLRREAWSALDRASRDIRAAST